MLTRGDVEKSGASVDDTGSAGRDRGGAVLHGLVDAPVEGGGRSGGDGTVESKIRNGLCQTLEGYVRVGDGAGELGGVSSAESELAVGVLLRGRRCEGDSNKVGGDQALGEGVASDYNVQLSSVHIQMCTKEESAPVGIVWLVPGLRVPWVKSRGPILGQRQKIPPTCRR